MEGDRLGAAVTVAVALGAWGLPPPTSCPSCWLPPLVTSWQIQLTGPVDLSVDAALYEIDLFDNDASIVAALHAGGRKAVCYLDAGTWESFRPEVALRYPKSSG